MHELTLFAKPDLPIVVLYEVPRVFFNLQVTKYLISLVVGGWYPYRDRRCDDHMLAPT